MKRNIIHCCLGLGLVLINLGNIATQAVESQSFDSQGDAEAAGWVANEEAQNPFRNIDLGWKASNHAGGAAAGEGGGLLHRSGQLPVAFYADTTIGTFTLDDPLTASGNVGLINNDFDGEIHIGFFDAVRLLSDPEDFGAELGFTIAEPNGASAPNYRWGFTNAGDDGNVQTQFTAWQEPGAQGFPDRTPLDFSIDYDPNDGDGALTLAIGDEPSFTLFLSPTLRSVGGTFTGFGLYTGRVPNSNDDRSLEIFIDDVSYTSSAAGGVQLQAGDADQDLKFDQLDLVRVQIAAKYLSGQSATWGEGDWDGAPGGQPGDPPPGNGMFDQLDIIAALTAGKYLTGPYAAVAQGGVRGDEQTTIVYNTATGEVAVDAPASTELTSINIDSAASIFTGEAALNLGGSFDNDADNNIFKATFGSSFSSLSFGNVAQTGLSEEFVLNDLTVIGSLAGGGDLGNVDLIYVPEPSTGILAVLGACLGVALHRWRRLSRIA